MHYSLIHRSACAALVLAAAIVRGEGEPAIAVSVAVPELTIEASGRLKIPVVISSASAQPMSAEMEFLIQRDPALYDRPAPHPLYGHNVALGVKSWAEGKGKPVVERNEVWGITNGQQTSINALTDGHDWTEFGTVFYNSNQWTETFGYIDLGKVVRVVHLSADMKRQPDKTGKIDFSASVDGNEYVPVEGLQGTDVFTKGFGRVGLTVPKPFEARFIRMRLHLDGKQTPFFRYPANVQVYGGIQPGTFDFPQAGATVMTGRLESKVSAGASATVEIGDGRAMEPGAYLISVRTKTGDITQLNHSHLYVKPAAVTDDGAARFGINVLNPANASLLKRAGATWARFEMQWPTISPVADTYKFDAPFSSMDLSYDAMMRQYHEAGLAIMPSLFLTPSYLAPKDAKDPKTSVLMPPTDFGKYGDLVFQTVARYGRQKHPAERLKTEDQRSGLGYLDAIELWNEPNTQNTRKTNWKGSLDSYYDLFRTGAEAAKKADPAIRVTHGGWSHLELPLLETLRTYKYPDGKTPLDFADVLNAHYFSYRTPPELATVYDISHHHEGIDYDRTVEQDLAMAVAWRDQHKPAMPIWISAIGHDSMEVEERLQAAWMPRGMLTALAAGVDKVMVFQEQGSGTFQNGATGILRDDGSLKPAWFTYANTISQLQGVSGRALRLNTDANVRAYLWKRGDRLLVTAWAVTGQSDWKHPLGTCRMTDAFGGAASVDLSAGLMLGEFPIYLADFTDAVAASLQRDATQYEQQQRQTVKRQSERQAYLFKFGKPEGVATILIGTLRDFTPVAAGDVYEESKGYGFEGKGLKDGRQPYYQHPLTEAYVAGPAKTRFTFKAKPGNYILKLCTRPSETPLKLIGFEGGEQLLQVVPNGHVSQARVKIGANPVTLETAANTGLIWLSVVEEVAEEPVK